MLLNEGVPPQAVIAGIDDLVNRMEHVRNTWMEPGSVLNVQNSYLQTAEIAERSLVSWFEEDEGVTAGLYDSPHYRMIREMTRAIPRLSPLIGDEVDRQVKALRRLGAKVREFLPLKERRGRADGPGYQRADALRQA